MNLSTYINLLREEITFMVEDQLTPVSSRYGYSDVPLETNVKWKPIVLIIGNYSSGKSTLINNFLGANVQTTGQAPTDDSFTIITHDDSASDKDPVRVSEEHDGKYVLNNPEYPFEALKKYGQRFTAHLKLKKLNSPFLKDIAIIDTPGMLDSITERDRGYNYQKVIGDLAQTAALILVLFDPHKAGTIHELHTSIREILPASTFENRILFVLNRIDECASLPDLLRVYGTLCWNLSQITGRKDIPAIHLTYSKPIDKNEPKESGPGKSYLHFLENQKDELNKAILQAPRQRLNHLATFVETHAERLSHFLEALINYRKEKRAYTIKSALTGVLISITAGFPFLLAFWINGDLEGMDMNLIISAWGTFSFILMGLGIIVLKRYILPEFHRDSLLDLDSLTSIENQTRKDSWQSIKHLLSNYLSKTDGNFSLKKVKQDFTSVNWVRTAGSQKIRNGLNKLAAENNQEEENTDF